MLMQRNFILRFAVFVLFFCFTFLLLASYCYEPIQVVTIEKEDIQNAAPTEADVNFSLKERKIITMLEKRHFLRSYPELSDSKRLKNLEFELFGKCWQYTDKEKRLNSIKTASSNIMLQGTALPASISSKINAKRMTNNIRLRKKDDVGLIDGMLRLLNPEMYSKIKEYSDTMYNKYEY